MLHLLACCGWPSPVASRAGQGRAPVYGPPHALVNGIAVSEPPSDGVSHAWSPGLAYTTTAWMAKCRARHVLCGSPVL